MKNPLRKRILGYTSDSESFKNIDISTEVQIPVGDHVGAFGVVRKHHTHEGIDLYAHDGDPVYAMESGVIVNMGWFTGEHTESDWWNNTLFIMIEGKSGVINYGEIHITEGYKIGDHVEAGSQIGTIATVLKKNKGRPMAMLHLELYVSGTKEPVSWFVNDPQPKELVSPTTLFLI